MQTLEGNMANVAPDVVLDTKGMICPMPLLKAKKAMDMLIQGQVLGLLSTDASTKSDIPALVQRLGLQLLETREGGGVLEFYIRKT
jgi:tRNA 2-thiouridine synthesizing protein A